MSFAHWTKGRAGKARDAGLIQHTIRDGGGVASAEPGDVREHVEGALRRAARDALDAAQPRDDRVAPLPELGQHLRDLGWPLIHRHDPGALRERRGARHRVRDELRHRLYEWLRERAVAEAPSGHRERLAE